jgi:uncharacterized protein Usg
MLTLPTHAAAHLPTGHPPVMIVVVDTEEEFDWSEAFSKDNLAVENIEAQRKLHERVYDGLGVVPTYAIDWAVAGTDSSIAVLRHLSEAGQCEIGAHLHPWINPPHQETINNKNSFPGNLGAALERAKLENLTRLIEKNFCTKPLLYKAGRYGVGSHTTQILSELGYRVDASVVPHTSFEKSLGPDFTHLRNQPYWFGPAGAELLELPVTTGFCGALEGLGSDIYPHLFRDLSVKLKLPAILARLKWLERIRLTPEGYTSEELIRLLKAQSAAGTTVFSLTYHSSSLKPGCTTYVRDAADLSAFYEKIKRALEFFKNELGGVFMSASVLHATLGRGAGAVQS